MLDGKEVLLVEKVVQRLESPHKTRLGVTALKSAEAAFEIQLVVEEDSDPQQPAQRWFAGVVHCLDGLVLLEVQTVLVSLSHQRNPFHEPGDHSHP